MRLFLHFVLIASVVFLVFADLAYGLYGLETLTSSTDADELTTATRQLRVAYHDGKLSEDRAFFSMECISSLWAKIAKWFRDHFESALPFFKQRAVTSEGAEHDASAFDATAISKEAARKYEAMVAEGEVKTMDPTDVRYGKFLALVGKHFAGHDELAKVKSLVEKHGNENKAALEILKTKKNLRTALFLSWALKKQPATDMAHRIVLNLDPDDRLHILEQAQELEKEYTIHLITLEILYRKIHRV